MSEKEMKNETLCQSVMWVAKSLLKKGCTQKGLEVGVVDPVYFTAVILLIVVSSVATPLALKALFTKMPPVPHPSQAKA